MSVFVRFFRNLSGGMHRHLLERLPDVVWVAREGPVFSYVSPAVEALTGYTSRELYNHGNTIWFTRVDSRDVAQAKQAYADLFRTQKKFDIHFRFQRKDGVWVWLRNRVMVVEGGRAEGVVSDITREKRVEEELRQSERRLEAIVGSMEEGLFVVDRDLRIVLINRKAVELLDLSPHEVVRKDIRDVVRVYKGDRELTEEERPIMKTLQTEEVVVATISDNYYFETRSKKRIPVFVSTAPFFDEGIAGVVTVFRDISEEKAVDQAKSQFISLASHQLRTPLTTLKWYTEALLDGDLGKVNKEQKKYLEELHRTNDRLLKLVSAFLNVSKIELGTFSLEPKLVNIEEIAEAVLSELVGKIQQKHVKIVKHYNPNIRSAYADPKLVDIIFQNLFANAIKYSPPKSTVVITLEQKKDTLSVAVEDHGCGIPALQQGKIFTKLFRADNARTIDPDGTGLGLYMTKSIVDASGGKVWFVSKENQGTTFYVLLPSGKTNQKEEGKTVL